MLVSHPLPDIQSGFESLQRSGARGTSASLHKSPSKTSSAPSYASSTSSTSSPADDSTPSQLQQNYGLDGSTDRSMEFNLPPPFSRMDDHPFVMPRKESAEMAARTSDSPTSSLQEVCDLYSAAAESVMSADLQSSTDVQSHINPQSEPDGSYDSGSFRAASPSACQDANFFASGCPDSQFAEHSQTGNGHSATSALPRKSYEHVTDKELRKKLKNRESAQAARDRKKAKMLNLERQIADLLERNAMVENENLKLRTRIQQLESEAYWRMSKLEQHSHCQDGTGYSGQAMSSHHSITALTQTVHTTPEQELYASQCSFSGTNSHHALNVLNGQDGVSHGNKKNFQLYTAEAATGSITEYGQANYLQHMWTNDHPHSVHVNAEGYALNSAYASSASDLASAGESMIG